MTKSHATLKAQVSGLKPCYAGLTPQASGRDPYGSLNPGKTEYVAYLITEVDHRMDSAEYNDELEPVRIDDGKIIWKKNLKDGRMMETPKLFLAQGDRYENGI